MEVLALECLSLAVQYPGVRGLAATSLQLKTGAIAGLAGESGCGKTTLLRAIAGLLPQGAVQTGTLHARAPIAYIPQDALASLSPYLTIGTQVADLAASDSEARALLNAVGLTGPRHHSAYPHQLSGGERQRVLIAQAMAMRPALILADEPTANLDPDNAERILSALEQYTRASGAAALIASHQERVFERLNCPVHRLTPAPIRPAQPSAPEPPGPLFVTVEKLEKIWRRRDWKLRQVPAKRALAGVSFELQQGEAVILEGPSGSGKSTLARCLAALEPYDSGAIEFAAPKRVQLVPQSPSDSLNPTRTVAAALQEAGLDPAPELLAQLALPPDIRNRRASQLSEGQRARVAILRAAEHTADGLLILDESLASLDDATRGEVIAYLASARRTRRLTLLLITHDAATAAALSPNRTLRLRDGQFAA